MIYEDIRYILSENPKRVIIGGRKAIREAAATLLREFCDAEIIALEDSEVENSTTFGMIKIYEEKRNEIL